MLAWRETEDGWAGGGFSVVRSAPAGWDLVDRAGRRSHHRRASSAKAVAARMEWSHRRRWGLVKRGAMLVIVLVGIGIIALFHLEPNPDRIAAEALVSEMDSAHAAALGGVPVAEAAGPGLTGATVPIPYGDEVSMLVGRAGGDCYALYWNDTRGPVARSLVPGLACEPSAAITQSAHNVYTGQTPPASGHLPVFGSRFDWEHILPPDLRIRPWAIPLGFALGAIGLTLLMSAWQVAAGGAPPARRSVA